MLWEEGFVSDSARNVGLIFTSSKSNLNYFEIHDLSSSGNMSAF